MLKELIESGYGPQYNCAEKIINGANEAYEMGFDENSTRLFAGFGGGMAVGAACGAVCGALGVISHMFVDTVAHQSNILKPITQEFIDKFTARFGSLNCKDLKDKYFVNGQGCVELVNAAAEILDEIVSKYDEKRAR